MVFLITYQSQFGHHEHLEWFADSSSTVASITECFRRRFPTATLLSCTILR